MIILIAQCLDDTKGDILDAVLCAIQASWACSQKKIKYGIPDLNNKLLSSEGWIINPYLSLQNYGEN